MEQVDAVVVGAGVVGLAVARALALAGREVLVLESAGQIGSGTSSRNSEVLHAGIYHASDSLKARCCVRGQALLYAYCAERGIATKRCGKLIVATQLAQMVELERLQRLAQRNGVHDLVMLDQAQAQGLEPALRCVAALHSPSTGIVDSHGLMLALQADLERCSGLIAFHTVLRDVDCTESGLCLRTADGTQLRARLLVNAAGLHAPDLARRFKGLPSRLIPPEFYAKGNYFALTGRSPFQRLIYPVPEAAGLGVHLTLDLAGQAKFGPDVQWVDSPDDLTVDPARGENFYDAIRRYWPQLADGAVQVDYAGIRPKISGPLDPAADFLIQGPQTHGVPGLVNLMGIESPGLTSCLAISELVCQQLGVATAV